MVKVDTIKEVLPMRKLNSLMQKVLMTLFSCLLCLTFLISLPFMVQSVNVLAQTKNDESQTNSTIDFSNSTCI